MWTGKFSMKAFIVSCAVLVPFCELMAEAQDETVYTAKYKFNYNSVKVTLSPVGTEPVGTSFSLSSNFKRAESPIFNWDDRVYMAKDDVGTISFSNFKYEVKEVEYKVMADILDGSYANITTKITDFSGNVSSSSYNVNRTLSFKDISFLKNGISSYLNGLKSLEMQQLNDNPLYLKGANDNSTPTFTISYYKPYASFNEKMPTALKNGTKIALSRSMFNVFHQGAFTDSDFSFESLDKDKIKIENGYMVGVGAGVARISVVIKNNGKEVNRTTIKVSVYDGDYCWSQGLLYMDFDPNGKNFDNAKYTGKAYDGLRLFDDQDEKRPYVWTKYEENTNGNLSVAISTKELVNMWRVAVGMINYTQYVPSYTSVKISYDFQVQTQIITKKCRNGAELLYFGETPWAENNTDKFSTQIENIQSVGDFTSICSVTGLDNLQTASSSYSFEAMNNASAEAKNIMLRFGLKTFARRYYIYDADQMGSFNASNRQLETTYYAYVTFVGGEGCPYTMPKHDEGKNYKLYTSNNIYTSYTLGVNEYVPGYTFKGWSTRENGPVEYQNNSQFNPYNENTKGGKGYVTLYAVWEANSYTVNLDHNNGSGKKDVITATYGQNMPAVDKNGVALVAPIRTGYIFDGYYSQDGKRKYYNNDMTSAKRWTETNSNETIYAHWTAKTYTVTFDLNDESHAAIFPDNVIANNKDRSITITSDGKMKVKFVFGESKDNSIDLSVPKKPGYEMLGWYDDKGDLIVTVDNKNRHAYITDKNNYWLKDGNNVKWNYAGNLVLKAKYRCKYTVVDADNGPIIKFDNEIVEPKQDWLSSVISDLQGAAKEVGTKENPVMAFDLKNSTNVWNGNGSYECKLVMESLQGIDYISPNVLVYFNDKSYSADQCNNAILIDNTCPNLYLTDRYEIKIPYAFKADKALYERNKNYNDKDAAKAQAANSKWGTLCLPYPIKNNSNNVRFYQLAGLKNNYMHFTPMEVDVIPANTPVLYKRLEGVGSEVKIEEASVDVPVNTSYETNLGSSLDPWKFIGTLTTQIFCGKEYDSKKVPVGAEKMDGSKDIYYFKQDKFTHLSNTGKVTMLPYRAYFTTTAANAKFTTFSIIAMDEEGATDITNLIDNDAEGDGKIYDLNGRRVMQPVSGRLYIVNGQKKVY